MEGAARAERGSDVSPAAAGDRWSGETGRHGGEQGAVQAVCTEGVTLGLPLRVPGIEETTVGKNTIRRPDEAAMSRLLAEQKKTAAGLILRLAWRQGLTREKIQRLTWDDVSFPDHQLCLPDRAVPLDRETETCLRLRFERQGTVSPFVVISDRLRRQMPPESISRLALCGPDQRHCRQHALRLLFRLTAGGAAEDGGVQDGGGRLPPVEAPADGGQLPGGAGPVDELEAGDAGPGDRGPDLEPGGPGPGSHPSAGPGSDAGHHAAAAAADRPEPPPGGGRPHVLLAPNSRRPIDQPRLSKLVRTALIRGGLETVSLGDLCREERREGEDARLLVYAAEKGAISRSEAMSILGLSKVVAYERLRQLTASGRLVRVGTKYYPAGQVVPPEEQYGVIREFLTQSGPAYRQDLAALLHIGDRQCALILKHMVEAGRLVRTGQRYALPVEEKAIL